VTLPPGLRSEAAPIALSDFVTAKGGLLQSRLEVKGFRVPLGQAEIVAATSVDGDLDEPALVSLPYGSQNACCETRSEPARP
jgi:hypothetical protein